jgi:hypothetical protein
MLRGLARHHRPGCVHTTLTATGGNFHREQRAHRRVVAATARAHFRVFGRGAPSSGPPALAHARGPNSDRAPWAAPKTGQGSRSITAIGLAKFRTCPMRWFFLPDP